MASPVIFAYTVPEVGERKVARATDARCIAAAVDLRFREGVAGVLSRLPARTSVGFALAVPVPSLPCASRLLTRFSVVLTTFPPVYKTARNARPAVGQLWPRK